ncbi:hypothetical protein MPL3356_110088 [Mesorhizobium plurifarium]|uniref:Uncharacterized protein n=1 Tax=Mesorhizobium plurifarium TaxID=69974 RepID=A0A090D9L9_MESPL|nr:hypothetical protein MPL3356_110088 [Mesorhizobium plurifarium]
MSPTRTRATAADGGTPPQIGDRITDKSAPPDDGAVREWIGPETFERWAELRSWIDESYPGVFTPDRLYGGKNRGWSLRYKKTKALCTLMPEYRRFSAVVVMGGAERAARAASRDKRRRRSGSRGGIRQHRTGVALDLGGSGLP